MSFLEPYWDADAVVPEHWTLGLIAQAEVQRLAELSQVAEIAGSLPKRRDGVGPAGQALDKKRSRAVAHLARQLGKAWMSELGKQGELQRITPGSGPDWDALRSRAATVNWDVFLLETMGDLVDRCRLVVTWSVRNQRKRFGNRAANRFITEMDRIEAILHKEES